MKFNFNRILQLAGIILIVSACHTANKRVANLAPNAHQVNALEVIQAGAYTYVRVVEDKKDYWVAINSMDVKEGGTYFWLKGMEMKNFTSKELKRTFPSIYFVEDFTDKPILSTPQVPLSSMAGKQKPPQQSGIDVPRAEGGMTIAELYAKKGELQGKSILIQGEVVKYSPQIMKKNWVHIQDGSREGDNYDLAITTLDTVKQGDIVKFRGIVGLNKDFGYGYVYDLILEDAKLIK